METSTTRQDIDWITQELGRKPRGKVRVAVRSALGRPTVIQVEPIIDGKPFTTLYWLVDRQLHKRISKLEANNGVDGIRVAIRNSPAMCTEHKFNHLYYMHLRRLALRSYWVPACYKDSLYNTGIGGIRNFSEIKCLHLHYAYHLVTPTLVGKLVDTQLQIL